jgi:hypothetical protein
MALNGTPANGASGAKKTMRAVVWEGKPYEMAVRDVPRPQMVMPEDAIVRMTTAAICGSDLRTSDPCSFFPFAGLRAPCGPRDIQSLCSTRLQMLRLGNK